MQYNITLLLLLAYCIINPFEKKSKKSKPKRKNNSATMNFVGAKKVIKQKNGYDILF